MGPIILTVPYIPDANLLYNEDETRRILKFFWPEFAADIDDLPITNDVRRFAQTALIAGIDGSYAYGYMDAIFQALTHRNRDVAQLGQRLARNFLRHWWRHARERDLQDVRIYDFVRRDIAGSLSTPLQGMFRKNSAVRGVTTIVLLRQPSRV